jgi:hypothetical protein
MNITEILDELKYFTKVLNMNTDMGTKPLVEAATMLCQQQAEIDLLRMTQPNIDYEKELLKPTFVGRELTDEEIRHIQAQCHLKDVGYDGFIMRFARAILRKAQEK